MRNLLAQFRTTNMLNKLIVLNVVAFIIIALTKFIMIPIIGSTGATYMIFLKFLGLSSDFSDWWRIWTPITSMFTHFDLWHILGNMLILFFIGRIFNSFFGDQKTLAMYLMCGLVGGVGYFLVMQLPLFGGIAHYAIGASGAVMGIVVGTAVYSPNTTLHLFGIFPIKLKWIALFFVLSDIISFWNSNTGGHAAHMAGGLFGALCMYQLKNGKDYLAPMERLLLRIFGAPMTFGTSKNYRQTSRRKTTPPRVSRDERLNEILDKISRSGRDSLTDEERDFLRNI